MSQSDMLLKAYLRRLRLPAVASSYAKMAEEAGENKLGYVEYLLGLIEAEICQRESNMRKRRLSAARFPVEKTLDTFEFGNLPNLPKETVFQLAGGEYIAKRENLIMAGPTGVGKTHLAIGLGVIACSQGRRVRFYTAAGLVNGGTVHKCG